MFRASLLKLSCIMAVLGILLFAGAASAEPTWEVMRVDQGPPFKVTFTVHETTVGIRSITVTEAINASVNYTPFPVGFASPITVVATKITGSGGFKVTLEAKDMRNLVSTVEYQQGEPPACQVSYVNPGPPFEVEFTFQDGDDGLKSISVVDSISANVTIPPFPQGKNDPVVVSATEQSGSEGFLVILEARDMGDRSTVCQYVRDSGDEVPPKWEIVDTVPGPPFQMEIGVSDTGSGLKSIVVVGATNAGVSISDFLQGTKESVIVEVSQVVANLNFNVLLEATDMNDNKAAYEYPVPTYQETRPEFDAVGNDNANFFQDFYKDMVIANGRDKSGRAINGFSSFSSESFTNTAGGLTPDSCFSSLGGAYMSALTPSWTEATYEWKITLQMKPAADIGLHILGCVLRSGEGDVWKSARQTGLYRLPWESGAPVFAPNANPRITVVALPGPFATKGFPAKGFYLDARQTPGLKSSALVENSHTIQSLSEGNLILALPRTGYSNVNGQTLYELSQGDVIKVSIDIPYNSTADIRFGRDNVVLKYLGVVGTEYTTAD